MSDVDIYEPCFTFVWKIQNFSYCLQQCREELCSPEFAVDLKRENRWWLKLFPGGINESYSEYISLFIESKSINKGDAKTLEATYEFSLLTNEGQRTHKKHTYKRTFEDGDKFGGFVSFALRNELDDELKSDLLPEDTLTIQCRLWMESEQDILQNGLCLARTTIEVDTISFEWAVDEFFSKPQEKSKIILSNSGILTTEFNTKSGCVSEDYVVIEISQLDTKKLNCANCRISAIKSTGETEILAQDHHFFSVENGRQTWLFPLFLTRKYLAAIKDKYLLNERMLHCKYATSLGSEVSVKEYFSFTDICRFPSIPMSRNFDKGIKSDLKVLYDEKTLCDVNLQVGTSNFSAHKTILCARSPVFKAMFTSNMKEKNSDSVNIEDLNGDTVERLLIFIYTDTVDELTFEDASKLYFAAEKYDLPLLKQHCLAAIKSFLSLTNVYEVLEFADMYHEDNLKECVQNFILLNDKVIVHSDDWERFAGRNISLAFQTLNFVHKKTLETLIEPIL